MTAATATPSLTECLAEYVGTFLTGRNLAARTRAEYANDLKDVLAFLAERCFVFLPQRVERQHLEAYLAELDRRGFAGNTRRRKVASIRSFFTYLTERGCTPNNPSYKLVPPERERRTPRVLTEQEYKRLQLACAHQTRDAAIIELFLQTGIRLSELARLAVSQVELPARVSKEPGNVGSVRIYGKGRKERTVTVNWKACRALKAYLAIRPAVDDPRLFLSKFKAGMTGRAIEDIVSKYVLEAGIPHASVHALRHTFATHMVKQGTKLDVVRQALGHEDLKTTSVYVELARDVMDKELQQNAL